MIVRNEEKNIEKTLLSLVATGYELVVVDTGSKDGTMEIVRRFTPHLYAYEWIDDFAAARNFAIEKASHDIILMVDGDEILTEWNQSLLEEAVKKNIQKRGRIQRVNLINRQGEITRISEGISRVFSKKEFCYRGRIHEQLVRCSDGSYDGEFYDTGMVFEHVGYQGTSAFVFEKAQRNIQLLLLDLKELGEDPYTLYQLGKSYYMQQNYPEACAYFSKTLSFDLDVRLEYVIDAVETYGYALINSHRVEEAMFFENIYDEFSGRCEFVFLMGLIYMNHGDFSRAIEEFQKAARFPVAATEGVNSYKAFYNIGVIYECLEQKEEALRYYGRCNGYEKAMERILLLSH